MSEAGFHGRTTLPDYLRREQDKIEKVAQSVGLDFFPTVFEILPYDRVNEVAAFGGFPTRYPHWRWGMEYERLSKSYEYGLSKIYELVINTNPAIAYLLEGNSLTDQKLVMCHVYGHVDFFKNNFAFRATDLDAFGRFVPTERTSGPYDPNRRWIDKMANHGTLVRRALARHGMEKVESFVDQCLSLENLVDPHSPFIVRRSAEERPKHDDEPAPVEVPLLRAKDYMEDYINPEAFVSAEREKREKMEAALRKKTPPEPVSDVLGFLLEHAPLERWEHSVLGVIRDEAYYFLPQRRTKILNEGWASYNHSRLMTEHVATWEDIIDYADNNAGVMATSGKSLNPYKLGVELLRHIEERYDRGQFGREWDQCDDLDERRHWDLRLGLGKKKLFEVRQHYTDVTFLDEFLTPEFAMDHGLFTFEWSERRGGFEVRSREFQKVKQKLLSQLTNAGSPMIAVLDSNHSNRGELLLDHEHDGVDLRLDYAERVLEALVRIWKRPVLVQTRIEDRPVLLRYDGSRHQRIEANA